MIDAVTYQTRRNGLRALAKGGVVLILGHRLLPRNYKANTYPFRQNSNLLYCAGVAHPGHALVIGETPDEDVLYGPPTEVEDVVWHGPTSERIEQDRALDDGGHRTPCLRPCF